MNVITNGIYTIYDGVADQTGPIYEAINNEVAKIGFRQQTKSMPEGTYLELWYLGSCTHEGGALDVRLRSKTDDEKLIVDVFKKEAITNG